jgi:hypothetical protein
MAKQKLLMLIGSIAVATATGCGSSTEATVTGIVTLDGNPIPKGMISFVPANEGTQAYAMSDESGNYEVYTGRVEGLRAGEYKVTVVARKQPTITKTADGGPAPPGEAITPRWYAYPDFSGLSFNIEAGSNEINLQLTSQPPAGWQGRGR